MLDERGILQCPFCKFDHLHQETVTAWFRGEDADVYSGYRVAMGGVHIVGPDDNPSSRRSGVIITFSCEGCEHYPKLAISQHKGQTLCEWLGLPVESPF